MHKQAVWLFQCRHGGTILHCLFFFAVLSCKNSGHLQVKCRRKVEERLKKGRLQGTSRYQSLFCKSPEIQYLFVQGKRWCEHYKIFATIGGKNQDSLSQVSLSSRDIFYFPQILPFWMSTVKRICQSKKIQCNVVDFYIPSLTENATKQFTGTEI